MIEKMLIDRIGLNYDTLGRKNVEEAISMHMRRLGLENERDLLKLVSGSKEHFDELAKALLVPETWFFRYMESFVFLAGHAENFIARLHRPLRILSIPCSSGEEPYSIAIALLASKIPEKLIDIDAVDVSRSALEKARQASYGANSFRGGIPDSMNRFFTVKAQKYEVVKAVRDIVKFQNFSIFDPEFSHGRDAYDVIFCRNLLIYFSGETQEKAIRILSGLLSDSGILFLGHAESGMVRRDEFQSVNFPSSFAFRRRTASSGIVTASPSKKPVSVRKSGQAPAPATKPPGDVYSEKTRQNSQGAFKSPPDPEKMLKKAEALADGGRLQEAEKICMQYLDHDKLNPFAHYILGLISFSMGRMQEAAAAFGKAVYLNPDYYDALIQLAFLKERTGAVAEASRIRKRAEKLTRAGQQ